MTELELLQQISDRLWLHWWFFDSNQVLFQNMINAILFLTGVIIGVVFGYGVTSWIKD